MYNSQNKKKLQIVLLVLVAVLTLGIGYASVSCVCDSGFSYKIIKISFEIFFCFKTNVLVLFDYIYKMFYNDNGDRYV